MERLLAAMEIGVEAFTSCHVKCAGTEGPSAFVEIGFIDRLLQRQHGFVNGRCPVRQLNR